MFLIDFHSYLIIQTETFINITFNKYKKINIFKENINFFKNNMEAKFIGKAKLTKQGQLTLPQEARKDLKIEAESDVYWYEINEVLVLVKDLVNPKDIMKKVHRLRR